MGTVGLHGRVQRSGVGRMSEQTRIHRTVEGGDPSHDHNFVFQATRRWIERGIGESRCWALGGERA